MKAKITSLCLFILTAISVVSCKKDDESVKARIIGKWNVNKVEVTGYTGTETTKNGTFGVTGDYMDFKANNDDQVELRLTNPITSQSNTNIGTYIGTQDGFNMVFAADGSSYCTINTLTDTKLTFTAKIDKTNVVKVYTLSR
jgi:hypothetical protein